MNINNSLLFGSSYDNTNNYSDYSSFDIEEIKDTLNRTHIQKETILSNSEIDIETYLYSFEHLDYISNYIYPFWKNEFLYNQKSNSKNIIRTTKDYNPFSSWSNAEITKYYMGLLDNTRCFEVKMSDITIGFASVLLLDEFNFMGRNCQFPKEIYENSALFYNFVIEKPFRKMGYGRIILEEIIKYIKNNYDYKYLILHVDNDNELAKSLYSKFNFKYISLNPANTEQSIYKLIL